MKKSKEPATQEQINDFVKNTKYILALKNGTLIPVLPTDKPNQWKDCYENTVYTLKPEQTHRKIFSGDTAIDDAIDWIDC
jgi:hypothetical protein